MTAQLVKGVGITEMVVREKERGFFNLPTSKFFRWVDWITSLRTNYASVINQTKNKI